jgi:hypothetical protein
MLCSHRPSIQQGYVLSFANNIQRIVLQHDCSPVLFVILLTLSPSEACFGKSRNPSRTRSIYALPKSAVHFQFLKHHDHGSFSPIYTYAFGIVHDRIRNQRWLPCPSDKISTSGSFSTHSFLIGRHNGLVGCCTALYSAAPNTQRYSVSR